MAEEEKISSPASSSRSELQFGKSESIFDDFPLFNCTELIDVDVLEKQIDIADLVSYFQSASNEDEDTTSKLDLPENYVNQEAKIIELQGAKDTETNISNPDENTMSKLGFHENSIEQEPNVIDFQGANFSESNISNPVVNFFPTPTVEKETKLESVEAVEGKGND